MSTTSATPEPSLEQVKTSAVPTTLNDLIHRRWSPRAFSDRKVSPDALRDLLQAAQWAASSYNEQPWRFIVGIKGEGGTYAKIFDTLVEMNQQWAKAAPVLLLTAGKKTFTRDGSPNHYVLHDTGAALANLMIQATSMGISVHGMGGFDHNKARETFHIPEEYEVGAAVAIGYAGDPASLPSKYQEMEKAPRTRKPLAEVAFAGTWGEPVLL